MHPQHPGDEPTWAALSPREKALAAVGMTGLGLGVLALVAAAVLLGVLTIGYLSRDLIEADGAGPLIWAALLFLPCGLLAGAFAYPVRLALRLVLASPKAKRRAETALSAGTTFLAALFVETLTPGLHVQHPWLPALLATLLIALAHLATNHLEARTRRSHNHP
ncbi:hypothetical protein [Streptomyces sp. WZ-12]|uniref:hypothetical protein n=1 Tax=Streptomyces sp. WZ-12 TaxID=3030210 RepID=UPI0023814EDA|nr:hypothetical protein [Streptomyces sp. WZ-12]